MGGDGCPSRHLPETECHPQPTLEDILGSTSIDLSTVKITNDLNTYDDIIVSAMTTTSSFIISWLFKKAKCKVNWKGGIKTNIDGKGEGKAERYPSLKGDLICSKQSYGEDKRSVHMGEGIDFAFCVSNQRAVTEIELTNGYAWTKFFNASEYLDHKVHR